MTQDTEYPPSIRILIIDDSFGHAVSTQDRLREYLKGKSNPSFDYERFPENGLEVLARGNTDLVILDPNSNALKPKSRRGIQDFLEPMRKQGCPIPVICYASPECMSMDEAIEAGATAYAPKEDYEALFRALDEVQPVPV